MAAITGIDTTSALTQEVIDGISAAGYGFVIKYCADTDRYPNKRLTHEERAMMVAAGLSSGFAWEMAGDTPSYFTAAQGNLDAEAVLAYFSLLGVPTPTPCFWCIDYPAGLDSVAFDESNQPVGPIARYAVAFHDRMSASDYLTGIYGPGACCEAIKAMGYAHYTWLANAPEWPGSSTYDGWDIRQDDGRFAGIDNDYDEANSRDWAW